MNVTFQQPLDPSSSHCLSSQQGNPYAASQSQFEPSTQIVDDSKGNNASSYNDYEVFSQESSTNELLFPSPWARLVSRSGGVSYDLFVKPNQTSTESHIRYNAHNVGRATKCDIRVANTVYTLTNISNIHCQIYCKINYALSNSEASPRIENSEDSSDTVFNTLVKYKTCLEVWVEDLSSNGTFVNNHRIPKKGTRQLHHGDMLSLINPELDPKTILSTKNISKQALPKACKAVQEEVKIHCYDVIIFLPTSEPKKLSIPLSKFPINEGFETSLSQELTVAAHQLSHHPLPSNNESSSSSSSIGLRKSDTIIRMLNQERSFDDYYETGKSIGVGGAGKVFEATSKETGIKYAVKVIDYRQHKSTRQSATGGGPSAYLQTILKEAELLRCLRHPHIIHLEDLFCDDRCLYLVMELSRGGDLFDRLQSKSRYPECEAKEVIRQVLEAISYLHSANVAHRDLKPENILLVSKNNDVDIKLTDFGLAKEVGGGGLKSYCGTPQYFSPEVLQRKFTVDGAGRYSLEADMWSVGVLIYVLLSGAYPFNDNTLFEQIQGAAFSFENPCWTTVSADAKDLITHLIVVDPRLRYSAESALKHRWFQSKASNEGVVTINRVSTIQQSSESSEVIARVLSTTSQETTATDRQSAVATSEQSPSSQDIHVDGNEKSDITIKSPQTKKKKYSISKKTPSAKTGKKAATSIYPPIVLIENGQDKPDTRSQAKRKAASEEVSVLSKKLSVPATRRSTRKAPVV